MLKKQAVAFIGAGFMGQALIRGLIKSGCLVAKQITISDSNERIVSDVVSQFKVNAAKSNEKAVERASIVILAVKPQDLPSVIKSLGKRAGISLNPSTGLETIENILAEVNMVLIMSVNPGFGGQSFIDSSLDRAVELKRMVNDLGLNIDIEIDGGIKPGNAARVRQAGANVLVAGSAIFGSEDYKKAISEIRG